MICVLDEDLTSGFPDPRKYDDDGLVAMSKTLEPQRILDAYKQGIFPWIKMERSPYFWCWFSPNPRMVLYPTDLKVSKSLERVIKSKKFEIRLNFGFQETMQACAKVQRPEQESTWIEDDMTRHYSAIHEMGFAHSIEAFHHNRRVGGLYGLAMGKIFFGESMFHLVPDASKVCLAHLVEVSLSYGIELIDCQVPTNHLQSMGARTIPRNQFLNSLNDLITSENSVVDWTKIQ